MASREQRERKSCDASHYVNNHEAEGSSLALKLPEGVKLWKPKTGVNRINIIGYEVSIANANPFRKVPGEIAPERTYWVHNNVGVNNARIACPAKCLGKPCPICEDRAMKSKRGGDKDELQALKPKERQLFNVEDDDDRDIGIQVWDVSEYLFGQHLRSHIEGQDPGDEYHMFADWDRGYLLKVTAKKENKDGINFQSFATIEFKPRKPIPDSLLKEVVDLDKLIVFLDYDEIKKLYEGGSGSDDRDEAPRGRGRGREEDSDDAPRGRGRSRDDDEKDEDETPRGRGRGRDEDDKDEDKPARSSRDEDDEPKGKKGSFEIGSYVSHPKHGICEVVRISSDSGDLMLEDSNADLIRNVDPKECKAAKKSDKADKEEDDEPRGRGRDKDEDEAPRGRGRSRDDDEKDEDKPARVRRGKDDDVPFDDDDKEEKRGKGKDKEEKEESGRGGGRRRGRGD